MEIIRGFENESKLWGLKEYLSYKGKMRFSEKRQVSFEKRISLTDFRNQTNFIIVFMKSKFWVVERPSNKGFREWVRVVKMKRCGEIRDERKSRRKQSRVETVES